MIGCRLKDVTREQLAELRTQGGVTACAPTDTHPDALHLSRYDGIDFGFFAGDSDDCRAQCTHWAELREGQWEVKPL